MSERTDLCLSVCDGVSDDVLACIDRDGGLVKLVNFCSGVTGAGLVADMVKEGADPAFKTMDEKMLERVTEMHSFCTNVAASFEALKDASWPTSVQTNDASMEGGPGPSVSETVEVGK